MRRLYLWPLLLLTGCAKAPEPQPSVAPPSKPQPIVAATAATPEPTFPPVQIGPPPGATAAPATRAIAQPTARVAVQPLPVSEPTPRSFMTVNPGFADGSPSFRGAGILCNDGTYSNSLNRQGACSHHGGIAGASRNRRQRW